MKNDNLNMWGTLAEALGLVSAAIYVGLQIYYGISYGANAAVVIRNIAVILLVYAGLTLLSAHPERVNGLTKEVCSGMVYVYTVRMLRCCKLIIVFGLLFATICDVLGVELNAGYSLIVVLSTVAVAVYYEYKIIKILRKGQRE